MKTIILFILLVSATFAQSPLLTLFDGGFEPETITYRTRVIADGGEVSDIVGLDNFIKLLKANNAYTNCKILADPNWGVKKNINNKVTKLYDVFSNDLVRSDTAEAPSLISYVNNDAGATSFNVLRFDGTNDYLIDASMTLAQPSTVFFGVRPLRWTGGNVYFSSYTWASVYVSQNNIANALRIDGTTFWNNIENTAIVNEFACLRFVLNGANSKIQYNVVAESTGDIGTGDLGGFCFGAGSFPFFFSNIETGTIAVFNSTLNATQTLNIQNFLISRWSL